MKQKIALLLITAILTALIAGCVSGPASRPDTVAIADVKSTKIPGSEYTSYKVKVRYALRSAEHGEVILGFDLDEPGKYIVLTQQKVARDIGEVEVSADVRLPKRSTVTLCVDLSEDPHPERWTPLAETTRLLTIAE